MTVTMSKLYLKKTVSFNFSSPRKRREVMIRKILMARKIRQPVCKQDPVLETGSWLSLKVAQPNALGVGMGREGQTGDQNPGLWGAS